MKSLVLLLVLVIHLGISGKPSKVVKLKDINGKEYTLQICSLATPDRNATCAGCNNQDCEDITCQMCNNQTDFFCISHDDLGPRDILPPSLTLATNCPATIVSSTTTTASSMVYTTCTMTYTTTVSMAPTPSVSKIPATNLQAILGTVVSILGILLAIVSIGWMCTCWAMQKRRRKMNINATNIR